MKETNLLLIFVKNPKRGHVKTRLAESVGNEKAYQVYLKLLKFTVQTAAKVNAQKQIWYSSFIDREDGLGGEKFEKYLQEGRDLGERMNRAFEEGFAMDFKKILIIGSDCPGITPGIIEEGFQMLDDCDVVVGPSEDGGYYLIGSKKMIPELFRGITWSTKTVYRETVEVLDQLGCKYNLLPTLNDIDTEEDLRKSNFE